MSTRTERLGDEIRDLVASCFQGGRIEDPRLEGVTITAVILSPDLQLASIYFRLYQDEGKAEALKGLSSAAGFLKAAIGKGVKLRRIPELRFFYDEAIERGNRIEKLARQVREEFQSDDKDEN